MRPLAIAIFVMAGLVGKASIANAADFTFNVPVDLDNLAPVVQAYQVSCQVTDNNPLINSPPWKSLGFGAGAIKPLSGAHSAKTTVTIAFNIDPNSATSAAQAKWYQCFLSLCNGPSACTQTKQVGSTAALSGPAWAVPAAQSNSVVLVSGPLPTK